MKRTAVIKYTDDSSDTSADVQRLSYIKIVVEAVITAMRNGDECIRCCATRSLGKLKAKDAVEHLMGYLKDPDPDVRCDVATALGEIGDRQAVPALIQSLHDEEGLVRICAINALAKIGDTHAVKPLIHAITSTQSFPYSMGELSGDYQWEIRERATEALGRIRDPRAVQVLTDILKHEDADIMLGTVFRSLIQLEDRKGVEVVASYLKDPDPAVRRKAAKAFVYAKDHTVIEYLTEALIDEDSIVKGNAIEAIANIGSEKETVPLVLLLKDSDSDVRIRAAEVICKLGEGRAVRHILPLLEDPVSDVRKKAVELLGGIGRKEYLKPLIKALEDNNEGVCGEAIISLGKIGDERAVQPLIFLLKDKKSGKGLRNKAIFALGKIGAVEGLQAVMDILRDREEERDIRDVALQIFPMFPKQSILDRVQVLLNDGDWFVKKGFARILRDFRDPEFEEILIFLLLNEESDVVKREAAISLACRGNEAGMDILTSLLTSYLSSMNGEMERLSELYEAVKNIRNDRAVNLLLQSMKSGNPSLKCFAARAAGQTENRIFVDPLLVLLTDEDKDVRREAVIALGRLGDRRALPPLIEAIYEHKRFNDLRMEVAHAFKWIDVELTTKLLLDILMDPEKKGNHWVVIETLSTMHSVS